MLRFDMVGVSCYSFAAGFRSQKIEPESFARPAPQGDFLGRQPGDFPILRLANVTNETMEQVWSDGGCFQRHTERLIDKDGSRGFIRISTGLVPLSETTRTVRIRCTYLFTPRWYDTLIWRNWEDFWGRSSNTPSSAFIASAADGNRGAVGIGYDHAFKLMQNSDAHHCMHAGPMFGDIWPGETVLRRSVILFGRTAGELFRRFEATGYRPDYAPSLGK